MYSLALFQLFLHFFVMFIFEATNPLSTSASAAGFLSSNSDNTCGVFPFHLLNCLLDLLKDGYQFLKPVHLFLFDVLKHDNVHLVCGDLLFWSGCRFHLRKNDDFCSSQSPPGCADVAAPVWLYLIIFWKLFFLRFWCSYLLSGFWAVYLEVSHACLLASCKNMVLFKTIVLGVSFKITKDGWFCNLKHWMGTQIWWLSHCDMTFWCSLR